MRANIAVYTGDLSYSTAKGIFAIVSSNPDITVRIFIHHKSIPF